MRSSRLRTNLRWHVTTDECRAAIECFDAWRRPGEPSPGVFGPELIPFLRTAMVRNGFEVH
jgi:hypothetical protein